jgi:Flp pilus assembly protein TadG
MKPLFRLLRRRLLSESRGSVSIETLIMVPLLFWAMLATVVFFDGFRSRNQTQIAAQTVADLLSRSTDAFTTNYLEGMNDVFDFLAASRYPTRLRITSVIWSSTLRQNAVQWSYGTRGLSPLPAETFTDLATNNMATLIARFGQTDGFTFASAAAQAPVPELAQRIPPVLPGEALILVESFAMWSPFANVGVGQIRFNPVVVTRPRFAPWINLEGSESTVPEFQDELTIGAQIPSLPVPVPEPLPEPQVTSVLTEQSFDAETPQGWTRTTTTLRTGSSTDRFLGPFGGETWTNPISRTVDLGGTRASARIEFDLLVIDSWDGFHPTNAGVEGEVFQVVINNTPISWSVFQHSVTPWMTNTHTSEVFLGGSRYTTTATLTRSGTDFIGAHWHDQIWRFVIDIQSPPRNFTIGMRARLNQEIWDEAWGMDNFRISHVSGTPVPVGFTPVQSAFLGTDLETRFPVYSGCPDHRLPANRITFRTSQLGGIGMMRSARGATLVTAANCPGMSAFRHTHASPTLVLNFNHDLPHVNGNRLRLTTEDSNNGRTCDATLLVRDPSGHWWFNDDISSTNWNPRLDMGHAPSGLYHVWIGHFSASACNTQFRIERY